MAIVAAAGFKVGQIQIVCIVARGVCVGLAAVDDVRNVLEVASRPSDRRECGEHDQQGHQRLAPRSGTRQMNDVIWDFQHDDAKYS
jgi:hypothetical protein